MKPSRLGLTVVVAMVAGCSGCDAGSSSTSARAYLDHALELMRANAITAPAVNWRAVTAHAHQMGAAATTPEGTYGAIIYAIGQLRDAGDLHALFFSPAAAKLQQASFAGGESVPSQPPTVSWIKGRLGLIDLPGIGSSPQSSNSRQYASTALLGIAALQSRHHPCGWIVDLRYDTGGDADPMLLGVGPILGEGRLAGFTGRHGSQYYLSYRNGTLSGSGNIYQALTAVADLVPAPPVAVLTGPSTASAGELVTVAFRGRPDARSFGASTRGFTTAPEIFRLADGAELSFGVVFYADRKGNVYRNSIKPDVSTPYGYGSSADLVAEDWLVTRPHCRRAH